MKKEDVIIYSILSLNGMSHDAFRGKTNNKTMRTKAQIRQYHTTWSEVLQSYNQVVLTLLFFFFFL
jgi:hypothetical protein